MWYLDRATNWYHRDAQWDAILENIDPSKIWHYQTYSGTLFPSSFPVNFRSNSFAVVLENHWKLNGKRNLKISLL